MTITKVQTVLPRLAGVRFLRKFTTDVDLYRTATGKPFYAHSIAKCNSSKCPIHYDEWAIKLKRTVSDHFMLDWPTDIIHNLSDGILVSNDIFMLCEHNKLHYSYSYVDGSSRNIHCQSHLYSYLGAKYQFIRGECDGCCHDTK